jgi:hypothetical protein
MNQGYTHIIANKVCRIKKTGSIFVVTLPMICNIFDLDFEVKREAQSPMESRRSPVETENRAHDSASNAMASSAHPDYNKLGKLG